MIGTERRGVGVAATALLTSSATLVCCVLPAVMVSLGAGAGLAGLVAAMPQLVWLSEHKPLIFGVAGGLLTVSGVFLWNARRRPCPTDTTVAQACARLRELSYWLYGGAVLSFGTDWPGTSASEYPINPMLGLFAAVTRQTVTGKPADGWFPDERISIADAIKAYTYNTAYANFEETTKGSIEVGKLADLTVLSKNLLKIAPKEFLTTDVVYTIVSGRIVFSNS